MQRIFIILFLFTIPAFAQYSLKPAKDDGKWLVLKEEDLGAGTHHTRHHALFAKYSNGLNLAILDAIDIVQSHAMDGGGYFVGKDSIPAESPVYYDLTLFGKNLIKAPRHASYCSGASYAAFIEALNLLLPNKGSSLSNERLEALRMQEPDGGRREDMIKFWGYWNADGPGTQFALVQYAGGMGQEIKPNQLRPGDFVNISWKAGLGHSVIFLGWAVQNGQKKIMYWSSQRATNGYGDQLVPVAKIKYIRAVRLTNPMRVFKYNPSAKAKTEVKYDEVTW